MMHGYATQNYEYHQIEHNAQREQGPTFADPFRGDCPEEVARKLKQDAVKFKNLL